MVRLSTQQRRRTRRAHGVTKQELAEIKAFEASKKDIAGKKWPTVYVLPSCACSAHSFPHYHPGMKWTEERAERQRDGYDCAN